jgi:hypothetical protein
VRVAWPSWGGVTPPDEIGGIVVVAADYPFLDILGTMIIFFFWVAWLVLLFRILGDVFRRHDIGGGKKTVWVVALLVLPFLGTLAYLVANAGHMAMRDVEVADAQKAAFDDYVRSVSKSEGGAAREIETAKSLLDSGAIGEAEFETLKAKALA